MESKEAVQQLLFATADKQSFSRKFGINPSIHPSVSCTLKTTIRSLNSRSINFFPCEVIFKQAVDHLWIELLINSLIFET